MMDRTIMQQMKQKIEDSRSTINQPELAVIYSTFHTSKTDSSQVDMKHFPE